MTVYAADWVLPVDASPIASGAVAVQDGLVTAVGTEDELGPADRRFEESAIVPGFVNAHSHLEYAVYAGFGDGLDFGPWLMVHVSRKRLLDWDGALAIARLGAAQCLGSGITTTADASFSGAAAPACRDLGLRGLVAIEVFGQEPERTDGFEEKRERVSEAWGDLVRPAVSPHAPYTVSGDLYAACDALGVPVATHLHESAAEQSWLLDGSGPWEQYAHLLGPPIGTTAIRMLAERGLLSERWTAAHCVHVDEEEIELLVRNGVGVAHCPRSNAYLGCGVAPARAMLDAGVKLGLGTDSPASTPSFDMFDEMRAAVAAARAREGRSDALSGAEALELATLGSARAIGLDAEIGTLAPGKSADLTVVSLAGSPYFPVEDPASAVVFGGSPERVRCTLVQGDVRYEKGVTDWHELTAAASSARARMLAGATEPVRELA
ncbi:MAG TPA: amidohydrolase family protein [Gaiellaceae bacterium]|nr:amidohydrolase family protein [Gaiellaceae bacterium]